MNNSDGNCFFFVNFIPIKELKLNKNLLSVVSSYEYNSETIKKILITEEDTFKFFKFFENKGFYFRKYLMKYAVSKSKEIIDAKKEKSIVKNTLIMILYFLEFRKIQQKKENRKKKLEGFIDDYIVRTGRILAKKISMNSFDVILQFLLVLIVTKMNNPSVEDIKTCSIENLFILKIFFRILNVVFIEDKEDNEIINSESVKLLSNLLEYFLNKIIGSSYCQKDLTQIQLSNRFLLSHYYQYSHDIIKLSFVIKHIDIKNVKQLENIFSQVISNIFSHSFTFHSLISPFTETIQNCLLNLCLEDWDTKKREIEFSSIPLNVLDKLQDEIKDTLQTGFYMSDGKTKISINNVFFDDTFSILISFYLIPKEKQAIYPIFSFKNNKYLNCIIKQNEDCSYQLLLNDNPINIKILPFKIYKIGFIHNKKNIFRCIDIESNSYAKEEIKIELPSNVLYELSFGYCNENFFNGIIGKMVYTRLVKDNNNEQKIKSKFITQYEHNILNKVYYSSEINLKDDNDLDKEEWMIHPSMFQFVPFIDNLEQAPENTSIKFVLKCDTKQKMLVTLSGSFHKDFYAFCSAIPSISFLDNDGFSFLFLILEYYRQVLLQLRNSRETQNEVVFLM